MIALTHMRLEGDRITARDCKHVDLFLGGHDHLFHVERGGSSLFVKSGSEFRSFSHIELKRGAEPWTGIAAADSLSEEAVVAGTQYTWALPEKDLQVRLTRYDVTSDVVPDPLIEQHIKDCYKDLEKKMAEIVCYLESDMDTKFSSVRTKETSVGNLLTDLMRKECNADLAILNSGNIRANKEFAPGFLLFGDLMALIPFHVPIMVLEVPGSALLEVLENSVSKYPALDGRFLQVSIFLTAVFLPQVHFRSSATAWQTNHQRQSVRQ